MPLAARLAALTLFACAGSPAGDLSAPIDEAPLTPGALRVRLVFASEADLDLYVTGPSRETVYFANASARDGGVLEADRRCDAPAPRVESIVFPAAPPGVYRVGVDFMVRCDGATDEAPYRLVIEAPGRAPLEQRGAARFGVFAPRVVELHVDDAGPARGAGSAPLD